MNGRIAIYFTLGIVLYRINGFKKSELSPKVPNKDIEMKCKKPNCPSQSKLETIYQIHLLQTGQKEVEKILLLFGKL